MNRYKPLDEDTGVAKPASRHTIAANRALLDELPFDDRRSFANAERGFIASLDPLVITRESGRIAFDLSQFDFLDADAPDTVNPSLWRQAQLNAFHHGLFEVTEGLYQVRSFDIANMTLIAGERGWIVVDPLTSSESAAAALALANEHLGARPVTGVIFTHSHVDHFAGVLGVTTQDAVDSGEVAVVAPDEFVEEALSENVLAGNVMGRRATYMYGNLLSPGTSGFVSTGLGAALSLGSTGFIVPNDLVKATGETRTIDGIEFEFQMTPGTEAPAEFVFYLPAFRALCMAEITSHQLHNVYTPRGAQVRDALAWSQQINESIDLFGARLDIHFASHHWPIWGREEAIAYLEKQRDLYKFIHDQTLRLANQGYTKEEIADQIALPDALGHEFSNRGYYGSVHHNARAVYVKYLGFFDGNPATLYPLPPTQAGERYLDYMGGADAVVEKAQRSFDEGDYRWVAEVLNHLMMVDPEHTRGRALLADTLEQLGYQSESAPWRNFFLCGALELRHGLPKGSNYRASEGMAQGMPLEQMFQLLAARLNPAKAVDLSINLQLTHPDSTWLLSIKHAVLNVFKNRSDERAAATVRTQTLAFKRLMLDLTDTATQRDEGSLILDGQQEAVDTLKGMFDEFNRRFPIVTKRDAAPD